jgi:aquaporin Z
VLEAVLTALLMLVILSVSTGAKGITAGIAIGSVIALEPCSPDRFAARR